MLSAVLGGLTWRHLQCHGRCTNYKAKDWQSCSLFLPCSLSHLGREEEHPSILQTWHWAALRLSKYAASPSDPPDSLFMRPLCTSAYLKLFKLLGCTVATSKCASRRSLPSFDRSAQMMPPELIMTLPQRAWHHGLVLGKAYRMDVLEKPLPPLHPGKAPVLCHGSQTPRNQGACIEHQQCLHESNCDERDKHSGYRLPCCRCSLAQHLLTSLQGSPARGNDGVSAVQLLPRWHPEENPLYHRRLSARWHDMCAESLGMPKVALCFLTRGPVHQVRPRSPIAFSWPEMFLCAFFLQHAPGCLS